MSSRDWRTVFEKRAPGSFERVERAFGKSVGQGNSTGVITDELLHALTEAYQQAGASIPPSSEPVNEAMSEVSE